MFATSERGMMFLWRLTDCDTGRADDKLLSPIHAQAS
jgi:hypothetical protein